MTRPSSGINFMNSVHEQCLIKLLSRNSLILFIIKRKIINTSNLLCYQNIIYFICVGKLGTIVK